MSDPSIPTPAPVPPPGPRPKIPPDLAAALVAAVPARLARRLDASPALAEAWAWTADAVTTDRGEVVRLTVDGDVVTAVSCSCLLAPRCLHIAAVVTALEPVDGFAPPHPHEASTAAAPTSPSAAAAAAVPTARHAVVAGTSLRVTADLLAAGAESSGAFTQAELLRAIHACRTDGLHRLAASLTRALRSIRELRADRPEFALSALTADLREALAVALALATGTADPALLGTARRDYEPIGALRLHGVLTEAVVARSGYAGAITYLIDDRDALYTRAEVAPGDATRAAAAYDASAGLGEAVLSHRELGRAGLFVEAATASADGRLGAGQRVRAVRAAEPSRWDRGPIDARFRAPLAAQLARIAARDGEPAELRPVGWDLAFVQGTLAGGPGGAVLAAPRGPDPGDEGGEIPLRLSISPLGSLLGAELGGLPGRDNLVVLARAAGVRVRAVGRVRIGAPRTLELLAIGPAPGEPRLALPEAWHGRANVHYDRIPALAVPDRDAPASPAGPAGPGEDVLAALRRRVERVVLGGAGTLPVHAIAELEREAAALAARALGGGAEVLRDLAALAHDTGRDAAGARRALDRTVFARAWLRAALYEDAARRRLSVAAW